MLPSVAPTCLRPRRLCRPPPQHLRHLRLQAAYLSVPPRGEDFLISERGVPFVIGREDISERNTDYATNPESAVNTGRPSYEDVRACRALALTIPECYPRLGPQAESWGLYGGKPYGATYWEYEDWTYATRPGYVSIVYSTRHGGTSGNSRDITYRCLCNTEISASVAGSTGIVEATTNADYYAFPHHNRFPYDTYPYAQGITSYETYYCTGGISPSPSLPPSPPPPPSPPSPPALPSPPCDSVREPEGDGRTCDHFPFSHASEAACSAWAASQGYTYRGTTTQTGCTTGCQTPGPTWPGVRPSGCYRSFSYYAAS